MNDRVIAVSEIAEIYNGSMPALDRVIDDMAAVRDTIEGLDPMPPAFEQSRGLHLRAGLLRAQANHLAAAASSLLSVAASCEALALVVGRSRSPLPIEARPLAKVVKKPRGRKR